ncbi:MAG TPA: hypothetical protein VGM09_00930 [Bradyrhizobium sp.]
MLAEKFFLVLETLRSNRYDDGPPRVVTICRHVAVDLPKAGSGLVGRIEARGTSQHVDR